MRAAILRPKKTAGAGLFSPLPVPIMSVVLGPGEQYIKEKVLHELAHGTGGAYQVSVSSEEQVREAERLSQEAAPSIEYEGQAA